MKPNSPLLSFILKYPIKEFPWENQALTDEIVEKAAGFDLFIGEKEFLNQGFGFHIVDDFLKKEIWPYYHYCLTDPDIRNKGSIRLFQKCGFNKHKIIPFVDALKNKRELQLFIKEKPVEFTKN